MRSQEAGGHYEQPSETEERLAQENGSLTRTEQREGTRLNLEKAMQEEEKRLGGVLVGIAERMKRVPKEAKLAMAVFIGASALTFGQGSFQKAYAGQKEVPALSRIETDKGQRHELLYDFVQKLYRLPDQPNAITPENNEFLKERIAIKLIRSEAHKNRKSQQPLTDGEMSKFLVEITRVVDFFVDEQFGNKDGIVAAREEWEKLQELKRTNPGLRAIEFMFDMYSNIDPDRVGDFDEPLWHHGDFQKWLTRRIGENGVKKYFEDLHRAFEKSRQKGER